MVDKVLHELTRSSTPTSAMMARWVRENNVVVLSTRTYQRFRALTSSQGGPVRKANLGELAIQEAMHEIALSDPDTVGVFLFEDHKIARASFMLPDNCRKISTRAWLQFLEAKGLIASATQVERAAVAHGRKFSNLRFPG